MKLNHVLFLESHDYIYICLFFCKYYIPESYFYIHILMLCVMSMGKKLTVLLLGQERQNLVAA